MVHSHSPDPVLQLPLVPEQPVSAHVHGGALHDSLVGCGVRPSQLDALVGVLEAPSVHVTDRVRVPLVPHVLALHSDHEPGV